LLLATALWWAPEPVLAQQVEVVTTANRTLEERTRAVASELRCPVCQGNSIQDSPSELAQEMKSVVRDQLAAGRTPEQVRQYFIDKYGEWILLEPTPSGFNLVVYLLPIVGVLGGGLLIWRAVRKWTAVPTPDETHAAGPRS
jgi:cytochrome c-type biogenesis protein CcmH